MNGWSSCLFQYTALFEIPMHFKLSLYIDLGEYMYNIHTCTYIVSKCKFTCTNFRNRKKSKPLPSLFSCFEASTNLRKWFIVNLKMFNNFCNSKSNVAAMIHGSFYQACIKCLYIIQFWPFAKLISIIIKLKSHSILSVKM